MKNEKFRQGPMAVVSDEHGTRYVKIQDMSYQDMCHCGATVFGRFQLKNGRWEKAEN